MLTIEPNDTFASANPIEFGALSVEVISGAIGATDIDFFQVELTAGDTIVADINAAINGSLLDSVLSIFDINGTLLAQNEDNIFEQDGVPITELDPFLAFTATGDNTYFVGVSGSQGSSGDYSLELRLEEFAANDLAAEPNNTIRSANPVELDPLAPVVASGVIGDQLSPSLPQQDVDLFAVELEEGDTIFADINAAIIGSELDAVLSIFDMNGTLLAQNDDNSFDDVVEPDPFQLFTASQDDTYFIAVSSNGDSSGFYNLELSFGEETIGTEVEGSTPDDRTLDTGLTIETDNTIRAISDFFL